MANAFKIKVTTLDTANQNETVLIASASTTLVKSVSFSHDDHNTSVTMGITKFGGSRVDLLTKTHTANNMTQLNNDVIALEAGDSITVASDHISSTDVGYVTVVYVENVTAVNGQSIDVLSDVDTTTVTPTTGQALVWDGSQWEPGTVASGSTAMDDLTDVNAPSPNNSDVLKWTSVPGRWEPVDWLAVMYAEFKQGTSSTVNNGAGTDSSLVLDTTTAKLKTGITEVKLTETSPGDIEFIVATDATGTTAFTALHIDGTSTANTATVDVNDGARLRLESTTNNWATVRNTASADTVITLPSGNGTLATTADLYTNADADARIAAASVTDLTDVTNAGSGAIITSTERSKLAGIETGATANQTDAYLLSRSNHTGTQTASTISDFDTEVSNNTSVVANTAKNSYPSADATKLAGIEAGADVTDATNVKTALDGMTLTSASITTGDRILIQDASASYEHKYVVYDNLVLKSYEEDELVEGQNITMNTGVSVASNRVVDIMGDALADKSNANSKKMLGFHTGGGVCVLQGMVDANAPIQGATAGSPLYLGASGAFSATPTTTSTEYSRVLGYYVGTLVGGEVMCYFDPSKDWVEIS